MNYSCYARKIIDSYPSGMRAYRASLMEEAGRRRKVLHLGCGHDLSGILNIFPAVTTVVGLDPDAEAVANYPGEGHVGDGGNMPFSDNEFDLVFSEMVLEHLTDPDSVFLEVARVLKPGGRFISVTPSYWSYKSLVAAFTPHLFHRIAVRLLRRDTTREDHDVYPTVYKANTGFALRRLASVSGLILERLEYVNNGPTWFQRFPGLFELGRLYHTILNLDFFSPLRCNIVVMLQKPCTGSGY